MATPGDLLLENYEPVVKLNKGLKTKLPVQTTSDLAVGGALAVTGAITAGGAISQSGVVPTVFHSGQIGVVATTGLTQKQIVTTETYYSEVFIPANTTVTGISVLNGHTTSASQHTNVGLANAAGTVVAHSATTGTQTTADTYQQIPFTTPYSATGPAKYFICVQGDATTGYIAVFGTTATQNFGASKVTGETYGTFLTTATYTTTTYTGALGPVADTY